MSLSPREGTARRHREIADGLVALSHQIHARPEPGFEEELASGWLCEHLSNNGFEVDAGACGLPTSIIARSGSGPLNVAFVAEYDCLPGIGACLRTQRDRHHVARRRHHRSEGG
jgi:metal-dependent amidase/aminoacylase/carboxypeptidase family protein